MRQTAAGGGEVLPGVRNSGSGLNPGKGMKKVGDYTVASCIGKGRYGVCFLACDPDGNKVVLKKFRPRMRRKNRNANHYEAVILSGLSYPAVPGLLGVVSSRRGYYFVLEYKEGRTLKEWLFKEKKVFTPGEIFRIGSQLFEVLAYLHGRNVVHGDISMSNVVYDTERISLLDFGLARYADGQCIRFSLDYARAADVLIYLLYSGYEGKGKRPWHEELALDEEQKKFLKNLMEPTEIYKSTEEVLRLFKVYFTPESKARW